MNFFNEWGKLADKKFTHIPEKLHTIGTYPLVILTLIGLFIILFILFKSKKVKFTARMLTHMAIAIALSVILSVFRLFHLPTGGDITLAAMVPILLVTFAYGKEVGFITGFVFGILNLVIDPYILQPIQVLFDYPLPSIAMGLAGFFYEKRIFGTIIAFIGNFISHFLSGWIFFGSYAPKGMNPALYSALYNASYVVPDLIICIVVLKLLPLDRILKTINPNYIPPSKRKA